MDTHEAREIAQHHLWVHPPAVPDPVLLRIEEDPQAYVAFWTTGRHRASGYVADAQGPGIGPLADASREHCA